MKHVRDIYSEYSRMRDNGLDTKGALNALRSVVDVLAPPEREELATLIRTREAQAINQALTQPNGGMPAVPPPAGHPISDPPSMLQRISPIRPIAPTATTPPAPAPFSVEASAAPTRSVTPDQSPAPLPGWIPDRSPTPLPGSMADRSPTPLPGKTPGAAQPPVNMPAPPRPPMADDHNIVWVNCPACEKPNQRHEVFCYACGQLLEPIKGAYDTRVFDTQSTHTLDSEYYGPDSVLVLRVRGSAESYEARPQTSENELVIGRSTKGSVLAPDIDLAGRQGGELGVSRLHISVRYNKESNAVLASDLGSANGSFLNGQRMMPKEVRVLRHGDELRLGKLVLMVSFRHPATTPTE